MDMEYLKYKIRIANLNISEFSSLVGMAKSTMYLKMAGERQWTCGEMKKIKSILNLSLEEFNQIFGF